METLKRGDIVQIAPGYDPRFAGCLLVVTKVTPDGPMGFIPTPPGAYWDNICTAGDGINRVRLICPFRHCVKVGEIKWIPDNEKEDNGGIPFIGFSAERLRKCPIIQATDTIECTICGKDHPLVSPNPDGAVLFYECQGTHLGALRDAEGNYRCIVGIAPTISGGS